MDIAEDSIAIIGTAFSLPGGVHHSDDLWRALVDGSWSKCSTPPPASRAFDSLAPNAPHYINRAGWVGREGVEDFDAAFFNISPGEAQSLRPNCRLGLELTHKALENAGISSTALQGKNVAVSIAVGTEDGWDMRRVAQEGDQAFDHNWAGSSEPSAIAGRVAHFFDFHGACATVSNACAGGAFALRDGIQAIFHDGADIAIVGALSTHFHPAAFVWASNVAVASSSGRCSAFSDEADGYVPSEGAVFFVLKRATRAQDDGDAIAGLIRGMSVGHNGATRTLTTPNVSAQTEVALRALSAADVSPADITYLEAHGTGTKLGDMLEMEAIQNVYSEPRESPLLVSSAKTILGHCQAAAALVGILKVLLCFQHQSIPPHHVQPREAYTQGNIQVPVRPWALETSKPVYAVVSSFGFTGGLTSIILQQPRSPCLSHPPSCAAPVYLLPFSAKSDAALLQQIRSVGNWAQNNSCDVMEIASLLSLKRAHYNVRRAILVSEAKELADYCASEAVNVPGSTAITSTSAEIHSGHSNPDELLPLLNLTALGEDVCGGQDRVQLNSLIEAGHVLRAAAILYERGHDLSFHHLYPKYTISPTVLRSFPTYPFQRLEWWDRTVRKTIPSGRKESENITSIRPHTSLNNSPRTADTPSSEVAGMVGSILHLPATKIHPSSNIFDIGIDSINSIELSKSLSSRFGKSITATDLYALLTIEAIAQAVNVVDTERREVDTQAQIDELIAEFGAPLQQNSVPNRDGGHDTNILLTGAAGLLGSAILVRLLALPGVKVYCPVRGDPMKRLHSAFVSRGHSVDVLEAAAASGRLYTFRTSDLADPCLGCSPDEYASLLQQVNVIVHGAWRLDFNLPVHGFRPVLGATRRLAQLCAESEQKVTYHFITSFSTSFGFPGDNVPEIPLAGNAEYAIAQGYALSKLVAEHSLYRIQKHDPGLFDLDIIRVGQICGHSQTGAWSREEMIPMILASIPTLKAVPEGMPEVSWIPSDTCADTLCDVIMAGDHKGVEVHNVANPHIVPWAQVVESAVPPTLRGQVRIVSWAEYNSIIQLARDRNPPIARLLPYFEDSVARGILPSRYCSLDVTETAQKSPSLRACPEITPSFVAMLSSLIDKEFNSENSTPSPPASSTQFPVTRVEESPVFLFGPWSTKFTPPDGNKKYTRIVSLLREYAAEETRGGGAKDLLETGALFIQLQTLALQLANYDDMYSSGVVPCAVVGYCFGEFAAAVAAGILSERTVVSILVQRALALRDVSGAMLNVFTDAANVRTHLAGMRSPPDLAILAGPQHVVLSGSVQSIAEAKVLFEKAAVKTVIVQTSLPYHSREVDSGLESFGRMRPYAVNPGRCIYVSGVTGTTIAHERLGVSYWLRHMREPVRFLSSMETVRSHLRKNTVIDIGPNAGLHSIVARYRWDGFEVIPARTFITSRQFSGPMGPSPGHNITPSPPIPLSVVSSSAGSVSAIPPAPKPHEASSGRSMNSSSVSKHRALSSGRASGPVQLALDVLSSLFGYEGSADLVCETFHSLGIDSLSFVRFTEELEKSGLTLSPTYFGTELTLGEIFNKL